MDCGNGKCDDGLNKSGKCICDPGWLVDENGKCEKCEVDTYGESCTSSFSFLFLFHFLFLFLLFFFFYFFFKISRKSRAK